MSSPNRRRQRRQDVAARAQSPDHMYSYCRVIGCRRPARAGTSGGLDRRYCRPHAEHLQRHGSVVKKSYPAKVLNPYRRAALEWLLDHPDNPYVQIAIKKVEGLYQQAGPHVEAFRLSGKSPREKAWAAWARLRRHEIDPRLPVAAWLAVELVVQDDPEPDLSLEFKRVQAAKLVHRMASGTHRSWKQMVPDPAWSGLRQKTVIQEIHTYPKSRGRLLRYLGKDVEGTAELLVEHALGEIRLYVPDGEGKAPVYMAPYRRGLRGRRRRKRVG